MEYAPAAPASDRVGEAASSEIYRRILVAFDGSPQAERALAAAIDLAAANRARLSILTAIPRRSAVAMMAGAGHLNYQLESEYDAMLRRAAAGVPDDVSVTTVLTRLPARAALLREARAGRFDLLVVGMRRHRTTHSRLAGRATRHVLHHSPIPVLVAFAAVEAEARLFVPREPVNSNFHVGLAGQSAWTKITGGGTTGPIMSRPRNRRREVRR